MSVFCSIPCLWERGTGRINRQQKTTYLLDTKILEYSSNSKFCFYNWNEKESEILLLKYKSIELRKVENFDSYEIINNTSSTHNVIALDSLTKITIFGKVSCQQTKQLLASKIGFKIIRSFVEKT